MVRIKGPDLEKTLDQIDKLVHQPGYLYSLSILVINDLFLPLEEYINVDWSDRVSYQEVSFLYGLLVRKPIEQSIYPNESIVNEHINETYNLLRQMHDHYSITAFRNMMETTFERQKKKLPLEEVPPIFTTPESIIESVFYSDSGAYDFQYWEAAPNRYANDNEWIKSNLGFSIEDAVFLSKKLKELSEQKKINPPLNTNFKEFCNWALDVLCVNISEIEYDQEILENVASNFSSIPGKDNLDYRYPSDYNNLDSKPLILLSDSNYLVPVSFDFARSIDESPFYWVSKKDKSYFPIAQKNRGDYTEEFAYQKLKKVFGDSNVYKGAKIQRRKGEGTKKKGLNYTDIDVLVLFGNKAIVVQAKSKKMTLLSRKGNIDSIVTDFEHAVQEAYDQAIISRKHIFDRDAVFIDELGNRIELHESINEVYILSLTTDVYPALHMQVHAFLKKEKDAPSLIKSFLLIQLQKQHTFQ